MARGFKGPHTEEAKRKMSESHLKNLTFEERSANGRKGAMIQHARHDPRETTIAACRALQAKFQTPEEGVMLVFLVVAFLCAIMATVAWSVLHQTAMAFTFSSLANIVYGLAIGAAFLFRNRADPLYCSGGWPSTHERIAMSRRFHWTRLRHEWECPLCGLIFPGGPIPSSWREGEPE